MPISFSHKIYEKSGYQTATDRRSDTGRIILATYRELFMRDQIDWFSDNIGVAYCTCRCGRPGAELYSDYAPILLTPRKRCNLKISVILLSNRYAHFNAVEKASTIYLAALVMHLNMLSNEFR